MDDRSLQQLPEDKVQLVYDFTYDGGGLHKGGTGVLSINGKKVGEGRIEKTQDEHKGCGLAHSAAAPRSG